MNENPQPHSGSRWEPAPDPSGARDASTTDPGISGTEGSRPEASRPTGESVEAGLPVSPRPGWRDRLRGRGARVGVAAGIVALSGVGGFALGSAAADQPGHPGLVGRDGDHPGVQRFDGRGGGPGDHDLGEGVPPGLDDDAPDPETGSDTDTDEDSDEDDDAGVAQSGQAT